MIIPSVLGSEPGEWLEDETFDGYRYHLLTPDSTNCDLAQRVRQCTPPPNSKASADASPNVHEEDAKTPGHRTLSALSLPCLATVHAPDTARVFIRRVSDSYVLCIRDWDRLGFVS